MKKCSKCKLDKQESEFSKNSKKSDGLQPWCKICKRQYDKYAYHNNIGQGIGRKEALKERRDRVYQEGRTFLYNYQSSHPCVDCGESDPIVLEFDHLENKEYNISSMPRLSIDKIQKEIDKCEVVCANCHKRRTAIQFDWYKNIER